MSQRSGTSGLYIMDADGTDQQAIFLSNTLNNLWLGWQPLSGAPPEDLDGDGDVDRGDITLLLRDRGKSVTQSACGPACDLDGDGQITALGKV